MHLEAESKKEPTSKSDGGGRGVNAWLAGARQFHGATGCPAALSFRPGLPDSSLRHAVSQHAHAFDLDLHRIPRLHLLRRPRRSRVDHVAGHQRHILAHIAHDRSNVEDEILRSLRLYYLAVEARLQQQVVVVEPRDYRRA